MKDSSSDDQEAEINIWAVSGLWKRCILLLFIIAAVHTAVPAGFASLTKSVGSTFDSFSSLLIYTLPASALIFCLMFGLTRILRGSDPLIYPRELWPPTKGLGLFCFLWALTVALVIGQITAVLTKILGLGDSFFMATFVIGVVLQSGAFWQLAPWMFRFPTAPSPSRPTS